VNLCQRRRKYRVSGGSNQTHEGSGGYKAGKDTICLRTLATGFKYMSVQQKEEERRRKMKGEPSIEGLICAWSRLLLPCRHCTTETGGLIGSNETPASQDVTRILLVVDSQLSSQRKPSCKSTMKSGRGLTLEMVRKRGRQKRSER
jgi:hypothetical protein